jgi:hypothetical protein
MSDEGITPSGQAVVSPAPGQAQGTEVLPPAATVPPAPPSQTTEPQFFTHEEAQALEERILNQAKSYSDKGRVALKKQLDAVETAIKTAETLGKPFSDADKIELRQKARIAAETSLTEGELGSTPPETVEQAQAAVSALYAHDLKMQGKYGIELVLGDPEVTALKLTGILATDKVAIEAAFTAKRDRLASPQNIQTQEASTSAGVRVPSTPGMKPAEIAKNAREYWHKAHTKK